MAYGNQNARNDPAGGMADVWRQLARQSADLGDEAGAAAEQFRGLSAAVRESADGLRGGLSALTSTSRAAADALRQLADTMAAQASRSSLRTAAPFVDLTGAGPGAVETLTPDGSKPKAAARPAPPDSAAKANAAADAMQKVAFGFQSIASLGGTPAGAISAAGGQLAKLAAQFGPWGQAASTFIQTASQLPQLFKSAADSVASYVQAFAPAIAQRYQRAWADLQAAIGEQLTPVLKGVTEVVRFFADTVAGLTPVVRPVVDAVTRGLRPVMALAGELFRELATEGALFAQAAAPLIGLFAELSSGPLQLTVAGMRGMVWVLGQVTKAVSALLGLKTPEFDGSSYGKSAQQAEFTTSEDLWRKMVEATANQGRGEAVDPVPNLLGTANTHLESIATNIKLFLQASEKGRAAVQTAGTAAPSIAANAIGGPVAGLLVDMLRGQNLKRN